MHDHQFENTSFPQFDFVMYELKGASRVLIRCCWVPRLNKNRSLLNTNCNTSLLIVYIMQRVVRRTIQSKEQTGLMVQMIYLLKLKKILTVKMIRNRTCGCTSAVLWDLSDTIQLISGRWRQLAHHFKMYVLYNYKCTIIVNMTHENRSTCSIK